MRGMTNETNDPETWEKVGSVLRRVLGGFAAKSNKDAPPPRGADGEARCPVGSPTTPDGEEGGTDPRGRRPRCLHLSSAFHRRPSGDHLVIGGQEASLGHDLPADAATPGDGRGGVLEFVCSHGTAPNAARTASATARRVGSFRMISGALALPCITLL